MTSTTTPTTTTTSSTVPTAEPATSDPNAEKILWSSISRNGTILVEAGEDLFDGAVSQTAQGILGKKATPGWEYFTFSNDNKNGDSSYWFGSRTTTQSFDAPSRRRRRRRIPRLKAVKFHVYKQYYSCSSSSSSGSCDPSDFQQQYPQCRLWMKEMNGNRKMKTHVPEPIIWVYSAVYNPEATTWESSSNNNNKLSMLSDVKSFLEKIVGLTALPRAHDPIWRTGGTLACQDIFASILLQRMQEVTYLGTMARLDQSLEGVTELMQSNITAIMDREEQLNSMSDKSSQLNEMANIFKKKTSSVRRRMMMQNAKHGIILGTAITAGVAICAVPPLIAIL